jgi:GH35 family endo-1,4-beta-xylanase
VSGENSDRFKFSPADMNVEFTLEDTIAQRGHPSSAHNKAPPVVGYNPYERAAGAKATPKEPEPRRKPTDLRKLSEWIRLQREVEALKQAQGKEPDEKS